MADRLAGNRTFLDLSMREYLGLREEMGELRRQNFNVITTALLATGGTAAAVGSGALDIPAAPQGLMMLVIAAFANAVCITAIGIVNTFKIVELQAGEIAESIRRTALGERGSSSEPLVRFQSDVRAFNEGAFKKLGRRTLGWLTSYGTGLVVGGVVEVLALALIVVGARLVLVESQDMAVPGIALICLNVVLALTLALFVSFSMFAQERWKEIFYGTAADKRGSRPGRRG